MPRRMKSAFWPNHLLESERKAYNPLSFCKTYTMDQQPLNTGEQKDMQELVRRLFEAGERYGIQYRFTHTPGVKLHT